MTKQAAYLSPRRTQSCPEMPLLACSLGAVDPKPGQGGHPYQPQGSHATCICDRANQQSNCIRNHSPISGAPGDSFGPVAAKPILAILANDTPASGGRAAPSGPAPCKSPFSSGEPERPRDWAMAASRASSSVMLAAARAAAGLDGLGIACRHARMVLKPCLLPLLLEWFKITRPPGLMKNVRDTSVVRIVLKVKFLTKGLHRVAFFLPPSPDVQHSSDRKHRREGL
ncbi:MAG: hypothetical protein FRX49_00780 [Trebouxia sp. A1-2]|nr:MAG: hypothetical protein FRX49_00780 [Trebouxia sp. A1-2]